MDDGAAGTFHDSVDDCVSTVPCSVDEYVSSRRVCTACPVGTTRAAGDAPSGAHTACEATTCSADEYVSSNVCTACAPGTTNKKGDNSSGADTVCAADEGGFSFRWRHYAPIIVPLAVVAVVGVCGCVWLFLAAQRADTAANRLIAARGEAEDNSGSDNGSEIEVMISENGGGHGSECETISESGDGSSEIEVILYEPFRSKEHPDGPAAPTPPPPSLPPTTTTNRSGDTPTTELTSSSGLETANNAAPPRPARINTPSTGDGQAAEEPKPADATPADEAGLNRSPAPSTPAEEAGDAFRRAVAMHHQIKYAEANTDLSAIDESTNAVGTSRVSVRL